MKTIRTLPIGVPPVDGEALDSWLEALAHRTHAAFGDLLAAVGLDSSSEHGTARTWIARLTVEQTAAIGQATGVDDTILTPMTLAHYDGRGARIDTTSGTASRAFPWGRAAGSRFCPQCLTETGGRWQLSWRLGWAFACTTHHCLLADACPRCGVVQRLRPHVGDLIPEPGQCSHPARDAVGRAPARCHGDLTSAAVAVFDADHPAIGAQQVVNSIIDSQQSEFGIYADTPQARVNVLSDIRAVAGRILAYATPEELDSVVPTDLLAAYRDAADSERVTSGPAKTYIKPGLAAPAHAAIAAVGVTAALRTLTAPTIAEAGHTMRWLISSSRGRGQAVKATNIGWGKNTTPTLAGAQLEALAPMLKPSDHLRYRIGSHLPAPPARTKKDAADLARRLPTMLWPTWSLRLALPNCHQRQLRPALSAALLVVGCRINLSDAAALTGSPISGQAVSRILQLLEHRSDWPGTRSALLGMADYLAGATVPIDYERRRNLDYTDLLPTSVWNTICRDTETRHMQRAAAALARCFLFERITGLPAIAAPFGKDDSAFRTTLADFPRRLTPDLMRALDRHAHEYLLLVAEGAKDGVILVAGDVEVMKALPA